MSLSAISPVLLNFYYYITAGFAFVYFEDDRDAADAIRHLDNMPFGHDRRKLSVEWARVCFLPFLQDLI